MSILNLLFKSSDERLAQRIVRIAAMQSQSMSTKRFRTFEHYAPPHTPHWRMIMEVLNTYVILVIESRKVGPEKYRQILEQIPKAMRQEKEIHSQTIEEFPRFISMASDDFNRNGKITEMFLGNWAIDKMPSNIFPEELGVQEIALMQMIGQELMLILEGKGWFGT